MAGAESSPAYVGEDRMQPATPIESTMPADSHRARIVCTCTRALLLAGLFVVSAAPIAPLQAGSNVFERFFGSYEGHSDTIPTGEKAPRDLSVSIKPYKNGFTIDWSTKMQKADGRLKRRGLSINFIPTHRPNIYASAMRTDLFGHAVPMDMMKGDPFVWVTIRGDTLKLYVLRIADDGVQDFQIDTQTLTQQGLHLEFIRFYGSDPVRRLTATLEKVGGG